MRRSNWIRRRRRSQSCRMTCERHSRLHNRSISRIRICSKRESNRCKDSRKPRHRSQQRCRCSSPNSTAVLGGAPRTSPESRTHCTGGDAARSRKTRACRRRDPHTQNPGSLQWLCDPWTSRTHWLLGSRSQGNHPPTPPRAPGRARGPAPGRAGRYRARGGRHSTLGAGRCTRDRYVRRRTPAPPRSRSQPRPQEVRNLCCHRRR